MFQSNVLEHMDIYRCPPPRTGCPIRQFPPIDKDVPRGSSATPLSDRFSLGLPDPLRDEGPGPPPAPAPAEPPARSRSAAVRAFMRQRPLWRFAHSDAAWETVNALPPPDKEPGSACTVGLLRHSVPPFNPNTLPGQPLSTADTPPPTSGSPTSAAHQSLGILQPPQAVPPGVHVLPEEHLSAPEVPPQCLPEPLDEAPLQAGPPPCPSSGDSNGGQSRPSMPSQVTGAGAVAAGAEEEHAAGDEAASDDWEADDELHPAEEAEPGPTGGRGYGGGYERAEEAVEDILRRKLPRQQHANLRCEDFGISDPAGQFMPDQERQTDFACMGLPGWLVTNLRERGLTTASQLQAHAIHIAQQRDVMVIAQTGMGKTACFLLAMLAASFPAVKRELLFNSNTTRLRAPWGVVVSPTRELAKQTYEELLVYTARNGLKKFKVCLVTGGESEAKEQQDVLGVCYLLCTPGRFAHFWRQGVISLDRTRCLVLDECDNLLQGNLHDQLNGPIQELQEKKENVVVGLYTATCVTQMQELARRWLRRDFVILRQGKPMSTAANVAEWYAPVTALQPGLAPDLLDYLAVLRRFLRRGERSVVFCNTKVNADWLGQQLEEAGLDCRVHHSGYSQEHRETVVRDFETPGADWVLVACDGLARGMDLGCTVYCFDMAADMAAHVSRVGRTGRAGAPGRSLTLAWPGAQDFCCDAARHLRNSGKEPPAWLGDPALTPEAAEALLADLERKWHDGDGDPAAVG